MWWEKFVWSSKRNFNWSAHRGDRKVPQNSSNTCGSWWKKRKRLRGKTQETRVTPLEVFLYKFHDCPVFFQLDMRQGYHQLLISPESGKVATWKLSDEAIHWILGKIPKTLNQHDDIPLGGQDLQKQNSLAESCRFWYYINCREMPVLNWRNRFLWTSFHEEWIETKLRKDWGCEKK